MHTDHKRSLVTLSAATSAAEAKQDYAAYEGHDAVQEGQGGTKVQAHGVDFWTTGSPARRFQVLGILTDARKDRKSDGNAIGSKSVAKKVLEVGGNAVIVAGADTQAAGPLCMRKPQSHFFPPFTDANVLQNPGMLHEW